jgi:succinate-semialdehyde dehydrogenase/glutarate-semialdehyde dehydrogenase
MPVFDEETFGPVASIIRASDQDDAIAPANASRHGLGASIGSQDIEQAKKVARQIDAGLVFVNGIVASTRDYPSAASSAADSAGNWASSASTSS